MALKDAICALHQNNNIGITFDVRCMTMYLIYVFVSRRCCCFTLQYTIIHIAK